MNKFAKLRAVNRLLVKIAQYPQPVVNNVQAQPKAPNYDAVAAAERAKIDNPAQSQGIQQATYKQRKAPKMGISSWRDLWNYDNGYARYNSRVHSFARKYLPVWVTNKLWPRKDSIMLQQLRKQRPADVTKWTDLIDQTGWDRANEAKNKRILAYLREKHGLTDQQMQQLAPYLTRMSDMKRRAISADTRLPSRLGLSANKQFLGQHPEVVMDRMSAGMPIEAKQAKGWVIPESVDQALRNKGGRQYQRSKAFMRQNTQTKPRMPRPQFSSPYMQNTTAVG